MTFPEPPAGSARCTPSISSNAELAGIPGIRRITRKSGRTEPVGRPPIRSRTAGTDQGQIAVVQRSPLRIVNAKKSVRERCWAPQNGARSWGNPKGTQGLLAFKEGLKPLHLRMTSAGVARR
jgi:hypothetical protein